MWGIFGLSNQKRTCLVNLFALNGLAVVLFSCWKGNRKTRNVEGIESLPNKGNEMPTVKNFTETRTTEGVILADVTIAYIGQGHNRSDYASHGVNAGSPFSLHLRARGIDGVMVGTVKVTRLRHTVGEWYSFRNIGKGGTGRTTYLRADVLLLVEGHTITLGEFYRKVA